MNRLERDEVKTVKAFMTPEEFRSIVNKNVAGVVFTRLILPEGDFEWQPEKSAPQYSILVNPSQEKIKLELSFLRQINNVRTALQPRPSNGAELAEKVRTEVEIANFQALHGALVSDTLNSFREI